MIMDSTNFKETVFHLNSLTETWSLDNDPDLNELKVATNNLKQLIYFDDNENKNENAIVDKSFDEMVIILKIYLNYLIFLLLILE